MVGLASTPTVDDPRLRLMRLAFGGMATQTVGALTRLDVPTRIGDRTVTAAELGAEYDVPGERMVRLLRAATALGVCVEQPAGQFALTELGTMLRADIPGSVHTFVRMFTDHTMSAAWARLDDSVRTGRPAFDDVFGLPFFGYLAEHPELSALFNGSMSQGTRAVAAALPAAYDFGRFRTVADIGGGDATLLAAVLGAHAGLSGVLYDSVEGAAQAADTLHATGLTERCAVVIGDFFAEVPGGADCYLLKSIIHDWDDERCATILGHCRDRLDADGRVLIVEPVLPDVVDPTGPPGLYLSDLNMLVNVGGRERTRDDFAALCERSGLRMLDIIPLPTPTGFAVIEAAPA